MVKLNGVVDMVVPRGGKGLIERVASDATVPVLKHLDGICHLYIHSDADPAMAIELRSMQKRIGTGPVTRWITAHR